MIQGADFWYLRQIQVLISKNRENREVIVKNKKLTKNQKILTILV